MSTKTYSPADYPQVIAEHNNEAFGFISRLWNRLENYYGDWKGYRETVNELERLTDRELEDIGVLRVDIRRLARQANF